ncbi:MAG: GGDEF domain-containing protein [Candidatus Nanopelagicales bacterium]
MREVALRAPRQYSARLRLVVSGLGAAGVLVGTALCMAAQSSAPSVDGRDLLWLAVLLQWAHIRSYAAYDPRWPVVFVPAQNVVIVAGVFLLPPALLPFLAAGYLLRRPIRWHWRIWNFAAGLLSLVAAQLAARAVHAGALGREEAVAGLAAVLAFWAVESTTSNAANWFADHVSPAESGVWRLRGIGYDLAILCLGAMAAISVVDDPWMAILAVPAVLLVVAACHALGRVQVSSFDAKTRLLAPHALSTWGGREVDLARRRGSPLTVVMTDIDWFRNVNNTHGHQAGDLVLAHVARQLTAASRSTDLAFRFGGEELMLLLPDTTVDGGAAIAERFRELLRTSPAEWRGTVIEVTASLGVAQLRADESLDEVMLRADAALLEAKRSGRDQVVVDHDFAVNNGHPQES